MSPVKSDSLSLAVRLLVAAVKSKITVAGEDMAVMNSATERLTPDAVAPVPLLEFFVGPLPGACQGSSVASAWPSGQG